MSKFPIQPRYAPSLVLSTNAKQSFCAESIAALDESDLNETYRKIWRAEFNKLCGFTYCDNSGKVYNVGVRKRGQLPDDETSGIWDVDYNQFPQDELQRVTDYVCQVWGSVYNFETVSNFKDFRNWAIFGSKLTGQRYGRLSPRDIIHFLQWLTTGAIPSDYSDANRIQDELGLSYNSDKYAFEHFGLSVKVLKNGKVTIGDLSDEMVKRFNELRTVAASVATL